MPAGRGYFAPMRPTFCTRHRRLGSTVLRLSGLAAASCGGLHLASIVAAHVVGAADLLGAVGLGGGGATSGVVAALLSPLGAVVGLDLLEKHWNGSAFMLNLFQCWVSTCIFAIVVASSRSGLSGLVLALKAETLHAMAVSSLFGIIIGDTAMLMSLQRLGAQRFTLVYSMKPFVSAWAGALFFGEAITAARVLSMACAVLGVLLVTVEQDSGRADTGKLSGRRPQDVLCGTCLAMVTVLCDVGSSSLTRQFGGGLGAWAIGGLRFGCAGACMGAIVAGCRFAEFCRSRWCNDRWDSAQDPERGRDHVKLASRWCDVPIQSKYTWTCAALGVFSVTCLCAALDNHAVFLVPLSLCHTLSSLGPIYSISLACLMKSEAVSARKTLGSALAVIGVATFCGTNSR